MSDSHLVALSLPDEESARDLARQLDAIDKLDETVTIVDIAIAARSGRGKVKLTQLRAGGAVRGGILGAIGGAFASLTSFFHDAGIDDDTMRRVAQYMDQGEVALFILYTGDWSRSSAVLQDALTAHGIRYVDQSLPSSVVMAAQSATQETAGGFDEEETEAGVEVDFFEPEPPETVAPAAVAAAAVADSEDEPAEEPEPVFGDDSAEEFDADESAASETEEAEDAALAAAAAAADATRAADAQEYAGKVQALGETVEMAGAADTRQGVEMLDTSSQIGEAGARMGLLSLERRYSGLELGRMAGELAQIGREVGEHNMPILSALLANRSGVLQRIAAEMVASAATARELAAILESTGAQVGELGSTEVDEGAARLATASALTAHAAQVGAAGLLLEENAKAEMAAVAGGAASG